jgi:hypothetical protein
MAIALDASSKSTEKTTSPFTWSHTTGTLTNGFMVVGVAIASNSADTPVISAASYNGVSMTQVYASAVYYDSYYAWGLKVYLFVLKAPDSGAHDVSITASHFSHAVGYACTYSGVNQANSVDATGFGSGQGSGAKTASITTVAANCWIFACVNVGVGYEAATVSATQTQRQKLSYCSDYGNSLSEDTNGAKSAGSNTMGATVGGDDCAWGIACCSIAPYVATSSVGLVGPGLCGSKQVLSGAKLVS